MNANTKIIFTRNSPLRTVLVNETTGKELYRIDTPRRFVGSVTRVFRSDPATPPIPNLISRLHEDANKPNDDYDPDERELLAEAGSDRCEEDREGDGRADAAAGEIPEEDLPLMENEIARLYWKWFSSTRIVFEGKIRRMAEYMPLKTKLRKSYVFNHNGVSYRWSLRGAFRYPRLAIDGQNETLVAQFHGAGVLRKKTPYLEVTPAGMDMLDHIIVTFIPVELRRRQE